MAIASNVVSSTSSTSTTSTTSTTSSSSHHHNNYHHVYRAVSNSTENIHNNNNNTGLVRRPLNYTIDEELVIAESDDVAAATVAVASAAASTTTTNKQQVPINNNETQVTSSLQLVVENSMPSPIPYLPPLTDSDYRTQSSSSSSSSSSESSSDHQHEDDENNNEKKNNESFDSHLNACESLLELEERFIELMQRGVQQYSRPLRHCAMIAPHQHQQLFQNIEKILAISEYQLNQLISKDESMLLDMFATIGRLYENKMRMSCEAFDLYLSGVRAAFELLDTLTTGRTKLARFLLDSEHDIRMRLSAFLLLPLHYVTQVQERLRDIRAHTARSNPDHATLTALIARLDAYVEKSRALTDGHENPLRPVVNEEAEEEAQNENHYEIEDDEDSGDEIVEEFDVDYQENNNERRRQTNTVVDTRLIYSSTLFYRQSCHKWKKIRVLFFADRCVMLDYEVSVSAPILIGLF